MVIADFPNSGFNFNKNLKFNIGPNFVYPPKSDLLVKVLGFLVQAGVLHYQN